MSLSARLHEYRFAHTHVHTHSDTRIRSYADIHTNIRKCKRIHIYECIDERRHVHTHTKAHIHTNKRTYIHTRQRHAHSRNK